MLFMTYLWTAKSTVFIPILVMEKRNTILI